MALKLPEQYTRISPAPSSPTTKTQFLDIAVRPQVADLVGYLDRAMDAHRHREQVTLSARLAELSEHVNVVQKKLGKASPIELFQSTLQIGVTTIYLLQGVLAASLEGVAPEKLAKFKPASLK